MNFDDLDFIVPPDDEEIEAAKSALPIYTLDAETDPFKFDRYPVPFTWGLYGDFGFVSTWGENCTSEMMDIVSQLPPGLIFIHNGGRFDIYYLMDYVQGYPALIINGRIVRTFTKSNTPKKPHQVRDSYAIMPFALEKYKKTKI